MNSNLESALGARLAALTPAALEALASKGLLRRAAKDLDQGLLAHVAGESERGLLVRVAKHEVTLPASGPAQAQCTCPATGVCQHILAACLFLQRSGTAKAAPTAGVSSPGDLAPGLRCCSGTLAGGVGTLGRKRAPATSSPIFNPPSGIARTARGRGLGRRSNSRAAAFA